MGTILSASMLYTEPHSQAPGQLFIQLKVLQATKMKFRKREDEKKQLE